MRTAFIFLKNKYAITLIAVIVWLIFFDRNNMLSQYELLREVSQLEEDKYYYLKEIRNNQKNIKDLLNDPADLEKFAREKYLMKRDYEDVYVVVEK